MAEDTEAAAKAAKAPTSADIERAASSRASRSCSRARSPTRWRPGTARRAALDAALAEIDEGREAPVDRVAPQLLAHARPRAPALRGEAAPRRRRRARPAPGRRSLGHPRGADRRHAGAPQRPLRPATANGSRTRGRRRTTTSENGERRGRRRRRPSRRRNEDEEPPRRRSRGLGRAEDDADVVEEAPEDPGANRRFWFEHATGAGKTVAAVGFIEASRTGGILILTHRRNLVDQFIGEISDRGYADRLSPPLLDGADHPYGPVTVETYQWFVRNAEDLRRLLDRDLRRGAHGARREDQRLHPRLDRPRLHRHDRHRRADRPPRRRPLPDPDLALRPRPGGPPRRDRAAALRAHPARAGRADDRQGSAAQGRGRPGLRPGGARQAPRPGRPSTSRSPTSTARASAAFPASSTPRE